MKSLLAALAFCALVIATIGCTNVTVVSGQQGKAWVVKEKFLIGSTFYNCDATSGKPKCYKVIKQ